MKKKILVLLMAAALLLLAACQPLDVVATSAVTSFDALLKAIPDNVAADDNIGGFAITAPDGISRFLWSKDYSQDSVYDAWLELDIAPFVEAGLDTAKLPEGVVHEGTLLIGSDFGSEKITYAGEVTPLAAFEQMVKLKRDRIGYHAALDHYGVSLGDGNMFEWAKDLTTNEKDMVFALNPQPFIDAGVDVNKVPGWVFAKVPTMDANGNKIEVDKLLKPFQIQ